MEREQQTHSRAVQETESAELGDGTDTGGKGKKKGPKGRLGCRLGAPNGWWYTDLLGKIKSLLLGMRNWGWFSLIFSLLVWLLTKKPSFQVS